MDWLKPIVEKAGQLALDGQSDSQILNTKIGDDYLTEMDLKVEEFLVQAIKEKYPEHSFFAEEGHSEDQGSEYTWVIDPIDGTKNYFRGLPLWAVSVGLKYEEEAVLGVNVAPRLGEVYTVLKRHGAFLNGTQLHVSELQELQPAHIIFDYRSAHHDAERFENAMKVFPRVDAAVGRSRKYGTAVLSLAYVASGAFDLYVDLKGSLFEWDYLVGRLMVQETGGVFREYPDESHLAGNETLVNAMEKIIFGS